MTDVQITGFEILRELGRGGMATVWKARQISLDRTVAIKTLAAHFASDPADVERFQEEARAAARLKHPGIVQVYDASAENGMYYFVMEYVAGYTVGEWVRRKGVLTESDALLVADCVAEALDYAWDKAKIVHCDVKPDNVMIDEDGTVKVTDLGLARTISAMSEQAKVEYVMGTPAYISPEQATGVTDLDCRADIYSLGAMLYQLVTGKMLFEGNPDDRVMEMQIHEVAPDPLDLNRKLSHGICWLVEHMLAKDRAKRHEDWREVREDIRRVKRGLLPRIHPLAAGASTIGRSKRRPAPDARPPRVQEEVRRDPMANVRTVLIVLGIALGLLGILLFLSQKGFGTRAPVRRPVPPGEKPVERRPPTRVSPAEGDLRLLQAARDYARANPDDYDGCITRFRNIVLRARDDHCRSEAKQAAFRVEQRKLAAVDAVMNGLDGEAKGALDEERFEDAAAVYESYEGPLAAATRVQRERRVEQLHERRQDIEKEREAERQQVIARIRQAIDDAIDRLCSGDLPGAEARIGDALAEPSLTKGRDVLVRIQKVLSDAQKMDEKIATTFAAQKGEEITVGIRGRPTRVVIDGVQNGTVKGSLHFRTGTAVAARPIEFTVAELDMSERLRRMGSEDESPAVALAKGILAVEAGATDHATGFFEKTGEPLAGKLVAALRRKADVERETKAKEQLGLLLGALGIPVGAYDLAAWLTEVKNAELSDVTAGQARQGAAQFRRLYGNTQVGRDAEELLKALEGAGGTEADPEPAVEPESARKTDVPLTQSVRNLLHMRNRHLESWALDIEQNDEGEPVAVHIRGGRAGDITPLAEVKTLRRFRYQPQRRGPHAPLKDISPLAGLPIEELWIENAKLSNIEPLRDMPLKWLRLPRTKVRDLTPLKGMPLERLDLSETRIFDFGKLAGLPLKHLDLSQTQVKNIGFLKGMPLEGISLRNTGVYNFDVLQRFPLRSLDVGQTQIRDLAPLKNQKITSLSIDGTGVSDLSLLAGMPLEHLNLAGVRATDFGPLRGLPLKDLDLANTRFDEDDLELLNGKQLVRLDLSGTKVESLWSLRGMPLKILSIARTKITDLGPLKGAPLERFDCRGAAVQDFGPLGGSPINRLDIDDAKRHGWFIRSLPKLRWLNGRDLKAKEF